MALVRTTIAVCALVVSTSASAEGPLDVFISFDEPYRCLASSDFNALLSGIIRWDEVGETFKGMLVTPTVPAAFRTQVGDASLTVDGNEYRATVPLRGTWHGLPLRSVVVVQRAESEGGFYLVFDASPEDVRNAANKAGFQIPESGSEYRDEDVVGVIVGVDKYEGTGALYCIGG